MAVPFVSPAEAVFPGSSFDSGYNTGLTNPYHAPVPPPQQTGGTGRTLGLQRFLIQQGYRLTPDGRMGPLTAAAQKDWQSGIHNRNSQRWNAKYAPNKTVTPSTAPPGRTPQTTAPAGAGKHPTAPASPNPLADIPDFHFVNPGSYAHNAVNAEYNPQIQELVRQQLAAKNQVAPNLANIQDWYTSALDELHKGAAGEATQAAQLDANAQARSKALMAAGGGDLAAAMGTLGTNELDQSALADKQFNVGMGQATAKAGAEAGTSEQARLGQLQADLGAQLLQTRGAKGSAYKTALDDAGQLRNQQLVAAQNYKAQEAMLPLQIQQAKLGITGTRAQQDAASTQAADEHTSNLQKIIMNRLQIRMGKMQLNGTGSGASVPDFSKVDPSKRQALRSDLLKSAMGSGANPMQVYNMLGNSMRAYSGGKWNPHEGGQPQQFRDALMQEYVNYWNSSHPHAGQYVWSFAGGKAPVRGALRPKVK